MPKKRKRYFRPNLQFLIVATIIVIILLIAALLFFNLKSLWQPLVEEEPIKLSETPEIVTETVQAVPQETENLKSLILEVINFRRKKALLLEKELSNFEGVDAETKLLNDELKRLDGYELKARNSSDEEMPTIFKEFYDRDVLNYNTLESKLKIVPTFISLSKSLNTLKSEPGIDAEQDFFTSVDILENSIASVLFQIKELYLQGNLNQAIIEIENFSTDGTLRHLTEIQTFLTKKAEGDISKLSTVEKNFMLTASSFRSQLFFLKNNGKPPDRYAFAHGGRHMLGTPDSTPHSGNIKILLVDVVWRNNRELNVDHTNIYAVQDDLRDLMQLLSHGDLQLEFDVLVFAVDEDLT